jgi:hypothetical protein
LTEDHFEGDSRFLTKMDESAIILDSVKTKK